MLLSPVIIGVALVALFHMLRDIKAHEVVRALRAIQPEQTIAAALFVAGGYFTLTFYDWFALRAIGRKEIPYRIAALAGFTSYSIGHNIGPPSSPAAQCAIVSTRPTGSMPSR